jgi:hypothetical protein
MALFDALLVNGDLQKLNIADCELRNEGVYCLITLINKSLKLSEVGRLAMPSGWPCLWPLASGCLPLTLLPLTLLPLLHLRTTNPSW